jgi:hypothetical protein
MATYLQEDDLRTLLHERRPRADKILIVLATFAVPTSVNDIISRAARAGLRGIKAWNVSTLLRRTNGFAIRTPEGWELSPHGARYLQEIGVNSTSAIPRTPEPIVASQLLSSAPFIDSDYLRDLDKQAELYKALHVQENSIRRLIEAVLSRKLGPDWWNVAASVPMKRKHDERLSKEKDRKWLPARSETGPLYSIDWSDLVTLIRKYEANFLPFIGEIEFMHRYNDLGLLRHVIAHNGFIEDQSDIDRATLALRDWNRQVANRVRGDFLGDRQLNR